MTLDKKNSFWNMIGSTANAFTSVIFVIIVTRINGINDAGIFTYGFATASIIWFVGNYITRPYQVTDISNKFYDSDYLYFRILTCIAMLIFSFLFCIIKQYDIYKSSVIILLCIYRLIEAACETFYAITQRHNQLYKVGISMLLKAVIDIVLFAIIDYITKNLIYSILTMIIVNIIILIIMDIPWARKAGIDKRKFTKAALVKLLYYGFFTFALSALNTYIINSSRYAIDDYCDNSTQTVFGVIIIPATFMSLLGLYMIQPALTHIADSLTTKNYIKLHKITSQILLVIPALGILVFIVAFFLEEPVLSMLYGLNLKPYKTEMLIIIAGSILFGLETVLSFVLIAFRKMGIQVIIFVVVSLFATILSYMTILNGGIFAAAWIYFISMACLTTSLFIIYEIQLNKYKKDWAKSNK